jgi:5-methylcytosine-specific restriction endonuclease McrA
VSRASISRRLRTQVLADAGGRCGYCRSSEEITGAPLEIEHLVPEARGGPTRRSKLWAACRHCNALKSDHIEDRVLSYYSLQVPLTQDE